MYYCELCCKRVPRRGAETDSELILRHSSSDGHRDNFYTEATDEEEEEEEVCGEEMSKAAQEGNGGDGGGHFYDDVDVYEEEDADELQLDYEGAESLNGDL